jgi:hypothetical protein
MSAVTLEDRLATEALDAAVEMHEDGWPHVKTLRHEDGSVTVVKAEEYIESWMSPRVDVDGNVANLVQCHSDYIDLDEPDSGIQEARERWGDGDGHARIAWNGRVLRLSCDEMVRRYLSIFRPDVAYYEPRWEVTGTSQGDWQWGWGYVLTADFIEGCDRRLLPHEVEAAKQAFDAEVKVYGMYFAGEVYYGVHLSAGEPIVAYGDHGAYVASYHVEEDACGGFLGYDDLADVAWQFTSSPVVA